MTKAVMTMALIGSLIAGPATTAKGYETWRDDECRFQSLEHGTWTAREERLTTRCAVSHWSVAGGVSKVEAVGDCESGWWRFANNAGQYLGLFQHAAASWSWRVAHYVPDRWKVGPWSRWTNSRSQIVTTVRMVHASGWGAWTCA